MNVHLLLHFRIGFTCHHPARVVELVATIVGRNNIHQHYILRSLVQSSQTHFEGWKHSSAGLGDDHLSSYVVESSPQIFLV